MSGAIAIGVGFRKACTSHAIVSLVREALSGLAPETADLGRATLVTIAEKDRPALREAAVILGLAIRVLPKGALSGTDDRITVVSSAAKACLGIPSVAEAAALAAAGPGATLLVSRIAARDCTCAIARAAELPA